MTSDNHITVTSPLMPDLEDYQELLKEIWASRWVTNNGRFVQQLEKELADYLRVPFISLFTNGTLPLLVAMKALGVEGEVITTPYSFVATSHAIWWSGLSPVFADVDQLTCNLDPAVVEAAITPRTTAILPVHCYGVPCDIKGLQDVADRHGLKVIYDAAHAFGVEKNGHSILEAGDMSSLSFHATKVFDTVEGGALVTHTPEMKQRIDRLRNFGFAGETEVVEPGINGKLDELRAAYGLLTLRKVDEAIQHRAEVSDQYREALKDIPGISMLPLPTGYKPNYSHFPIFIDAEKYGRTRDQLYEDMKAAGILCRRYFYPLITDFVPYKTLPSAQNLTNARHLADTVLCLPLHHAFADADMERVIGILTTVV